MYQSRINRVVRLLVLAIAALGLQSVALAQDDGEPELPPQCVSINVPEGNKLAHHLYARGVQIYKWNGVSWDFDAPRASLFAEENYFGEVGSHFRGPTWESKSGSKVVAARVPGTGCTPDASAIAWLLLQTTEAGGPGIFRRITYVQRVNTTGGLAPTAAGTTVGELQEVPYTAEYFFYRAQN
ncbi:MAG TPA: DUF3455 domain-containing protein [Pyrinomonadaceae bacterium]|nr:DUF3455 domain-containing protein [Pyrinomonadaceae bacterium]